VARRAEVMPVLEENEGYEDFIQSRRRYEEHLVSKWAYLLEGTRKQKLKPIPEHLHKVMAMLFENQQATCRRGSLFGEDNLKSDVTLPEKYALPIIRKVYPELWITKVGAIQPLPLSSGGVGRVFYQDFIREADDTSLTSPQPNFALGSEGSVPKKVKMTIESETVEAEKDILGACWSTDVQEDARGAMGIDIESELVDQISQEILREHDQRCITELTEGAGAGNADWHWTLDEGYTAKEWYETLADAVIDSEDLIFGYRFRNADWMLCGRNAYKFIRKMSDFKPADRPSVGGQSIQLGVELVGRIEGFWDVYRSPYQDTNKILLGPYPRTQTDTGYIYAPYIPLGPMPLVYGEYDSDTGVYKNTDKWSRNVRTRHATALVVPELYSTVELAS